MARARDGLALAELLARNLGCSRTAARKLIDGERVTDESGHALSDPRAVIQPGTRVLADDAPVVLIAAAHFILHKPVGVVTALRDARHPTAYALLDGAPLHAELRPAGRLDLDTSGLLLWTTDGALVQRWTHPKRRVPRTYQAALARPFRPPPDSLTLEDGRRPEIAAFRTIDRGALHPALATPPDATTFAEITIVGGAYHEVRRIFAALGSHVLALCRTRFGRLALPPDLPAGSFRPFDPTDA